MSETTVKNEPIPGELLSRLIGIVSDRMGLYFPPHRHKDFVGGIGAAAEKFGFDDAAECAEWLVSTEWSRDRIETLAACLTIGETYFFRNAGDVALLRDEIIPALVGAHAGSDKTLRFWSAGSCTGEEPYTIAMLLCDAIPHIEEWNISILGTDINPRFLRKAAEGVFSAWSFRATPDEMKERYFRPTEEGRFAICPSIRKMVRFAYLNLASDSFPSHLSGTNAMDVILCRNVLIYFTPAQSGQVLGDLGRSLVEGGWLLVSPSDGALVADERLNRVESIKATCFRKAPLGAGTMEREKKSAPRAKKKVRKKRPPPAVGPSRPIADRAPVGPSGEALSAEARARANAGELSQALARCEEAAARNKMDPEVHHLHAAILQELGRFDEAADALRRVLYLDSDHVLAHFALGSLCMQGEKEADAKRHFANALDLLRGRRREELIEHSEGITAGRMITIIEAMTR